MPAAEAQFTSQSTARDREIMKLRETGLTYSQIGQKFGLGEKQVAIICRRESAGREEVKLSQAPRGKRRPRLLVSKQHGLIGAKVGYLRTKMRQDIDEFAAGCAINRQRIYAIEKGHHDLSISELQKISSYTGLPLEEFLHSYPRGQ